MDINALQNRKLSNFIKLVYHHHPYYRKKMRELNLTPSDIRSKKDLMKFPVTLKTDWVDNIKNFVLQPTEKTIMNTLSLKQKLFGLINKEALKKQVKNEFYPVTFFSTSGRSSAPALSFLTDYDLRLIEEYSSKSVGWATRDIKTKIIQNTFPYSQHLGFWQCYLGSKGMGSRFFSIGAGRTEIQLKLMEKFEVNILAGMPTYVKYLSDKAVESKINSKVQSIIFGGEGVPKGMGKRIKENFASIGPEPKLIGSYGATESKIGITECSEGSGYHTFPHLHIWEVLDPKTHEPVGEEEPGLLTFTYLDFRGTCFIRYSPGDYLVKGITTEKCPHCGLDTPRIIGKIKRLTDQSEIKESKIKGTLVNYSEFDDILLEINEIDQFRVIITKSNKKDPYSLDKVVVELGLKPSVDKRKVKDTVIRVFKNRLELTPEVTFENPEKIFDKVMVFKGVRIIDERKK